MRWRGRARRAAAAALVLLPVARGLQQDLALAGGKRVTSKALGGGAEAKAPSTPGCYVYMPRGCPRHPEMATSPWYKDIWHDAAVNRTTCEMVRPPMVKSYCNITEISLVFVEDRGQSPRQADDFWAQAQHRSTERSANKEPAGEPTAFTVGPPPTLQRQLPPNRTYKDEGEVADEVFPPNATVRAPASEAPHMQQLARQEMKIPPLPNEPGCYVLTPYGCPERTAFEITARKSWVRDMYGENHLNTGVDQAACNARNNGHYAQWCGVAEVRMGFVPV